MKRARFIAGAVCPSCGVMDRLVLEADQQRARRRCVACGYEDELTSASSREPKTRLDGVPDPDAAKPQSVRILSPSRPVASDDSGN